MISQDGEIGQNTISQHALTAFAALVVLLMFAISAQVVFSYFDINPVAIFASSLPVIGKAITLNSLLDFQWHLLSIIALMPAYLVWMRDGHVRVDFIYSTLTPRHKAAVEIAGHIFLTAPFLLLCTPAAWRFMMSAFTSGQGSRNDGLNDLFLVKAMLPIGLGLLLVVMLVDLRWQITRLRRTS